MKEIIEKLSTVNDLITSEKNGVVFNFFALFERTNLIGKWDLIISSKWLNGSNNEEDLVYVIEKIKTEFDGNLDFLGKILLINPSENFIKKLANAINEEKNITNNEIFDLKINDVYIHHIHIISMSFKDIDTNIPQAPLVQEEVNNF